MRWFIITSLVMILLPLCVFDVIPSIDLPQHLSISAIIWRLLQHDQQTAMYYQLHLQPVPYYLVYVLLVPLVGLTSPLIAAKIFFGLLAIGIVCSLALCLQVLRAPGYFVLGSVFIFYQPLLYWGFIATLFGLPFVFLMTWALLSLHRHSSVYMHLVAICCAVLATLSHAILLWPVLLLVLACITWDKRRFWPIYSTFAALLLLLVLGFIIKKNLQQPVMHFSDIHLQWHYIKYFLSIVHSKLGATAHGLWLLLLLVLGYINRHNSYKYTWFVIMIVLLITFICCPRHIIFYQSRIWGVSFRYLTILEFFMILFAVPHIHHIKTPVVCILAILLSSLYMASQWNFWQLFNQQATSVLHTIHTMQPQERLIVKNEQFIYASKSDWIGVLTHIELYYLAERGLCSTSLFQEKHLPIQAIKSCDDPDATEHRIIWNIGRMKPE